MTQVQKELREVLDYSVLPNDDQIAVFKQETRFMKLNGRVPFWNIKTGDLTMDHLGSVKGVLLADPRTWDSLFADYKSVWSEETLYWNKLIQSAQIYRLEALCDLSDYPDDANLYKVANQLINEVFLPEEVPYKVLKELFDLILEKNNYDLFLELIKVMSLDFIESIINIFNSCNIGAIDYLLVNVNTIDDHKKALLLFSKFVKVIDFKVDSYSTGQFLYILYTFINNGAWDDGSGKYLKILDEAIFLTRNSIYSYTGETFEFFAYRTPELNDHYSEIKKVQKMAMPHR